MKPQTLRARRLRKQATEAERQLWQRIRNRQLDGAKFRRQVPIGPYIVDFACLSRKIVIELDGGGHAELNQAKRDTKRDRWLKEQGFRVLRFWDNEVFTNMDGVLSVIRNVLLQDPHPDPLPKGEGRIGRDPLPRREVGSDLLSGKEREASIDRICPLPLDGGGRVGVPLSQRERGKVRKTETNHLLDGGGKVGVKRERELEG